MTMMLIPFSLPPGLFVSNLYNNNNTTAHLSPTSSLPLEKREHVQAAESRFWDLQPQLTLVNAPGQWPDPPFSASPPSYGEGSGYPDVLFEEPTDQRIIALSIDDAPSTHTDDIMQVLEENDAHATFFVIGSQVEGRKDKLVNLVAKGHELGNHAMHDEPSKSLSNQKLLEEVHLVKDMLTEAYAANGQILPNNYFRPGSGIFNRRMRDVLGNQGFRITLGSVYPHDPQIPYPDTNAKHILSMAHPGAIIICHDRRSWTVPMLRTVLPELRRQGYRIVTITDLVKAVSSQNQGQ
ncbi:nodulation nodB [Fusarium coicis]|nr:nodulation nodB [Fusarium coicis]